MEFILDTADLEAVKQLDELLTIEGVTTNPSIITKSGKTPEQVIKEFVEYLRPEQKFFVQVVSTDYEQMLEEARYICSLRPKNTYVKIPVTHNGYKAIKQLKSEGLGVLATAIYSADEAFLAAMNGADYLAPYVNRMCNYGDGSGQVLESAVRVVIAQRGQLQLGGLRRKLKLISGHGDHGIKQRPVEQARVQLGNP